MTYAVKLCGVRIDTCVDQNPPCTIVDIRKILTRCVLPSAEEQQGRYTAWWLPRHAVLLDNLLITDYQKHEAFPLMKRIR